jgi:hypothetical protein
MEVYELVKKVESKDDFIRFLDALRNDLKSNPNEWENNDLNSYLNAMKAWTVDMEGYFKNQGIELPVSIPWNVFANVLLAAKMYE